jgi:hypothetical protein
MVKNLRSFISNNKIIYPRKLSFNNINIKYKMNSIQNTDDISNCLKFHKIYFLVCDINMKMKITKITQFTLNQSLIFIFRVLIIHQNN